MARPHALRARAMALARPTVSLATFGRSYQVAWRRRAPLLARPHGPHICAMALVRPRLGTWCSGERSWKGRALLMHDAQKGVNGCKGEGEACHTTHPEISAIGGVTPSLAPSSPKSMLRPNKILVLAIAADAVRIHSKARESPQAPIVEPPKDVKGKRTARISVKPLWKQFSQRIIARGGPSRPKPTKNEVIDLVSDEEKEAAEEKKDPEPEDEEEEEDPEEASTSLTLPSPPKGPSGAYDDPHYWDYDGDLDQWGINVLDGEPAAAQASDSAEGSEGSCSPSCTSAV
ncbi:hypothetical protein PIB30_086414 [Stylosanthes scabra]|uniref:Uncharacterized protein n=1 Tax=Stylosanthes scabra TaxID=79078 RepID=A0ABU6YS28_9FABA|nr:hypothetical protein [Stylosanthes scabra]